MDDKYYWVIDFQITFRSDFHVGEGTTLIGGNLHGLRMDENGFPYMPHTQVKGLLRLGGSKLAAWLPELSSLFIKNFPETRSGQGDVWWSYTRAAYSPGRVRGWGGAGIAGMLGDQTHISIEDDTVSNLFSYQKGLGHGSSWPWQGTIYSVEPAREVDVAFLANCMRAEDRIGSRRSRGYGKVDWRPNKIRCFQPGRDLNQDSVPVDERPSDLKYWIEYLLKSEVK